MPLAATLANRVVSKLPLARELALVDYFVARAISEYMPAALPSVSIFCPTRNEKGNIREAVLRTPMMGPRTELIFVDGNSSDGTVEEIEAVIAEYEGPLELKLVRAGARGRLPRGRGAAGPRPRRGRATRHRPRRGSGDRD